MSSARFRTLVALVVLGTPAIASAQTLPAVPALAPAPTAAPVPAPLDSPPRPGPKAQPIDSRTAVRRALSTSPTLAATKLGVAQANQDVLAEEGRYPYVFQADGGATRGSSPRIAADDSVRTTTSSQYTVGTALRRTFPTGTTAEIRVEGQRFESGGSNSGLAATQAAANSGYGATARASVSQHLLRGFGTDVGEAGLRLSRISRVASEKARRRAVSELTRDVLLAYWELWYADESVRIDQAALDLARAQEQQAEGQRASGALAPADVYEFSSRVAGLEETMVQALLDREQRSLELNRLMGVEPSTAPELFAAETPVPGVSPTNREIEAALRSDSIELAEAETQVKLARSRAETAGEDSRASLDLEGYIQTDGESRTPLVAARRAGELDWLTVHVGAVYQLPLDATQKNAQKESALIGVRIAEQNLKAMRQALAADAVQTVRAAHAAEERLTLAARTVAVAEKAHEAARGRFELGGGIALAVKQAEEELQRARLSLARTRVDLVRAQIAMRHLAGTLAANG